MSSFRPGDIVFVGPAAPLDQKVTWVIRRVDRAADCLEYATLSSGLTGRTWVVPTTRLTHYVPEGANT